MKKFFALLILVVCATNMFACTNSDNGDNNGDLVKQEQEIKTITVGDDYRNFVSKAGGYIYTFDTSKDLLGGGNVTFENVGTLADEQSGIIDEAINVITNIETATTEITALKTKYISTLNLLKEVYLSLYKAARGEMDTSVAPSILEEALSLYGEFVNEINAFEEKY